MRLLLAASLLAGCGGPDEATVEALHDYASAQMKVGGFPGLAVAIVTPERTLFTHAYGHRDIERRAPLQTDSILGVASLSKTVTSVAVMQQVESGAVDLDAPITDLVGFEVRHPSFPDDTITLRMLLAHVSGLNDDWVTLGTVSVDGDPTITPAEFVAGYVDPAGAYHTESSFADRPEQTYNYSNVAFSLLSTVVERASGMNLRRYSDERIFGPLGMDGSGWFIADVDEARLATPYAGTWDSGFDPLPQPGFAFYPSSSLRTSVDDLSRFLKAFMRGGELEGVRLLSEETVSAMKTPPYPSLNPDQGLVWFYEEIDGRRFLGHTGSMPGGSAAMFFSDDVGVIILTNSDAFLRHDLGLGRGRDHVWEMIGHYYNEAAMLR